MASRGARRSPRRSELRPRLRRPDFLHATRIGERISTRYFIVFVAERAVRPNTDGSDQGAPNSVIEAAGIQSDAVARLGITVTRKVGNAVRRNRIKRLVREWFRSTRDGLGAYDVVVIAKRDLPERLSAQEVRLDLEGPLSRRLCAGRLRPKATA